MVLNFSIYSHCNLISIKRKYTMSLFYELWVYTYLSAGIYLIFFFRKFLFNKSFFVFLQINIFLMYLGNITFFHFIILIDLLVCCDNPPLPEKCHLKINYYHFHEGRFLFIANKALSQAYSQASQEFCLLSKFRSCQNYVYIFSIVKFLDLNIKIT